MGERRLKTANVANHRVSTATIVGCFAQFCATQHLLFLGKGLIARGGLTMEPIGPLILVRISVFAM
jgi:hypothetical protein